MWLDCCVAHIVDQSTQHHLHLPPSVPHCMVQAEKLKMTFIRHPGSEALTNHMHLGETEMCGAASMLLAHSIAGKAFPVV